MANPVGRPPIHTDPVLFDNIVNKYIESGQDTLMGLVLALGFVDKHTLYEYAKKPEFSHSVRKGLAWVEHCYEQRLKGTAPTGSIFALKNFGWKDTSFIKQETEHSFKDTDRQREIEDRLKCLEEKK